MPRVLVVSNRLPVTINPDKEPPNDVKPSSGGLVSALLQVAKSYDELIWIGWPGAVINDDEVQRFESRMHEESKKIGIGLVPVWLTQGEIEDFYNGYSNSSLWPLLHWMTPFARFKRSWAESYKAVNEKFADAVLAVAQASDLIWVQDYHLFLMPQLLRKKEGELNSISRKPTFNDASSQSTTMFAASGSDGEEEDGEARLSGVSRPAHLERAQLRPQLRAEVSLEDMRPSDLDEVANNMEKDLTTNEPSSTSHSSSAPFKPPPRLDILGEEDDYSPSEFNSPGNKSLKGQDLSGTTAASAPSRDPVPKRTVSIERLASDGKLKIAFFLHTPFPTYEVLCVLPQCDKLIEGVLGADLVGFHTYGYLRHFRSCVVRACGFTPEIDRVDHQGQRTRLGVFPIGANVKGILQAMDTESFTKHLEDYTAQFQGKNLVLSVERLDYSKGMPQKLAAIHRYLENVEKETKERMKKGDAAFDEKREEGDDNTLLSKYKEKIEEHEENQEKDEDTLQKRFPSFKDNARLIGASLSYLFKSPQGKKDITEQSPLDHEKTVFLFVAVPSRQEVRQYQDIEEEVHQTISRINGRFSTPMRQPLVYIHRPIPIDELAALYARADCCLVTPLIDGMNLVAKEFIVAKDRDRANVMPGSLVLSELAGASQELFDAIIVNPYDEEHVAEAIYACLELTRGNHLNEDGRWMLSQRMREDLIRNDAEAWARRNIEQLNTSNDERLARPSQECAHLMDSEAACFFEASAGTKALFLDYDGTLREFEDERKLAVPSGECHELFKGLDVRNDLEVFIVSGRDKEFLKQNFKEYKSFTLIAEHGFAKHGPDTDHEWRPFNLHASNDWMQKVKPIMDLFQKATPGAEVEEKTSAIVWHFRNCDKDFGRFKAKELAHYLSHSLGNLPCQISQGHYIVEVSSLQVQKGLVVLHACRSREAQNNPYTQVLCIGDDRTDESMFVEAPKAAAPKAAYTVKVGEGDTHARWRLDDPKQVRRFLKIIVDQRVPDAGLQEKQAKTARRINKLDTWTRDEEDGKFKSCREQRLSDHDLTDDPNRQESQDDKWGDLAGIGETEEPTTPLIQGGSATNQADSG